MLMVTFNVSFQSTENKQQYGTKIYMDRGKGGGGGGGGESFGV